MPDDPHHPLTHGSGLGKPSVHVVALDAHGKPAMTGAPTAVGQ